VRKLARECEPERLQAIAARHPDLIEEVRGFGMWYAIVFPPVVPGNTAFGMEETVGEFTTFLGMMMLHRSGVLANVAANSHRTVRLTPPLTIPEPLY
jgi:putrescine aminotransferase